MVPCDSDVMQYAVRCTPILNSPFRNPHFSCLLHCSAMTAVVWLHRGSSWRAGHAGGRHVALLAGRPCHQHCQELLWHVIHVPPHRWSPKIFLYIHIYIILNKWTRHNPWCLMLSCWVSQSLMMSSAIIVSMHWSPPPDSVDKGNATRQPKTINAGFESCVMISVGYIIEEMECMVCTSTCIA